MSVTSTGRRNVVWGPKLTRKIYQRTSRSMKRQWNTMKDACSPLSHRSLHNFWFWKMLDDKLVQVNPRKTISLAYWSFSINLSSANKAIHCIPSNMNRSGRCKGPARVATWEQILREGTKLAWWLILYALICLMIPEICSFSRWWFDEIASSPSHRPWFRCNEGCRPFWWRSYQQDQRNLRSKLSSWIRHDWSHLGFGNALWQEVE